ncbi:MAG TPA: CHAT domain-containing protein [Thermoanaerobaculia bacterium]|nr:CHAT domain-containing protein [Thermoanaerobaculia bacterium]
MRVRSLRVLRRAMVLSVLIPAAVSSPFLLAAPSARQELYAGAVLERALAGGESHSFDVEASPGERLLITVEQRGTDIVIDVLRPDGTTLLAVDGIVDGPETLLLPAEAAGPFEIRVRSPNPGVAPGDYTLRLEELGASTPRERIEAERLMTEAAARFLEGTGDSLRLGLVHYQEAQALWRSLGEREREARCALAAGDLHTALGQPRQALELYQKALALFVELADETGQATAWSNLGSARTALGDFSGGVEAERRALDLERSLGRLDQEGKVLNHLGLAFHSQGELRQALDFYEQALAVFDRVGENGLWKGKVLHNLAAVHMGLGEAQAALESHRQILALQRRLGDPRGEAQTLNSLGVLSNNLGEFGQALEAYAPALASFRQLGDRLREAAVLHNLGVAFHGLGDYPRALVHLEQALSLRREVGDRRGEVATEVSLGHVRLVLGETAPALDAGRRAARLASEGSDRNGEMLARLLLGQIGVAAGEPEAALAELAKARDLARQLEDPLDEATILQITGQAHLALGQADPAVEALEAAVGLARAVRTPARLAGALTALARAERLRGRLPEARSRLEEALGWIETVRAREPDPILRASYLAARYSAFELAIDLLMELDRREPGQGYAREALEVSERARARSLLDLLQGAGAEVREGVDPELRARERALLLRLNGKAGRQAGLLRRSATEESRRAAEAETLSALADLTQVEAEIRRSSPRYAALTRPPLATSFEIQGLLDGETLLLHYSLGEERSFLWAVDRSSVTGFELPPRARIEALAREVHSRLSVLAPGDERHEESASTLSQILLGPVAARLAGKRLIVAADGGLHYVPFAMLPDPGASGEKGSVPLLAGHEVVNVPSASAVVLQRRLVRPEPAPDAVAVLADPVFDPEDPRVAGSAGGSSPVVASFSTARVPSGAGSFLRLPWTRREAQAISAVAPAGRSLLALDFRASRQTALSPELSRYRIVHFATHGVVDSQTPALSGLMLSRVGEEGKPMEGFLGLGDVYNLRLRADLVVLSGCETALGKELRGEGLVGLTQGFLYSGAKQVVASLWRVEDRATAELMSRFYRGLLLEGRSPAAALREAQLAVRSDKRWRSPYYWSGFVLQGDWQPASSRDVR